MSTMGTAAELVVCHLLDALATVIAIEGSADPAEGVRLWTDVVRRGVAAEGNAQVGAYQYRLAQQGG